LDLDSIDGKNQDTKNKATKDIATMKKSNFAIADSASDLSISQTDRVTTTTV
jgi:hypothetical protein